MSLSLNIKKIRISLEYMNSSVVVEVEPYRQIKFLKERAGKIFYPLNSDIILRYSNKDLTPFDSVPLGDFFKNKSTIHIKIIKILSLSNRDERVNINKEFNNYNINNVFKELNLNNNHNLNKNNNPKDNMIQSPKFLSPIQKKTVNDSLKENYILCSCSNDIISYYCRVCNSFICRICRMNLEHRMHNSVHVDLQNLEESIKLYAISLQADINLNMKESKKYSGGFEKNIFVEPSSRKEIIIRKLDEIERKQEQLLQSLPKINEEDINQILNDFDVKGFLANQEIEEIIERIYLNYSKRHKRISFDATEKYFNFINSKEKELEKFNINILIYKYNFQVHKKIDSMYKIIEKAIDAVLSTEMNNLFGSGKGSLDDNSLINLEMIQAFQNFQPKSSTIISESYQHSKNNSESHRHDHKQSYSKFTKLMSKSKMNNEIDNIQFDEQNDFKNAETIPNNKNTEESKSYSQITKIISSTNKIENEIDNNYHEQNNINDTNANVLVENNLKMKRNILAGSTNFNRIVIEAVDKESNEQKFSIDAPEIKKTKDENYNNNYDVPELDHYESEEKYNSTNKYQSENTIKIMNNVELNNDEHNVIDIKQNDDNIVDNYNSVTKKNGLDNSRGEDNYNDININGRVNDKDYNNNEHDLSNDEILSIDKNNEIQSSYQDGHSIEKIGDPEKNNDDKYMNEIGVNEEIKKDRPSDENFDETEKNADGKDMDERNRTNAINEDDDKKFENNNINKNEEDNFELEEI